MTFRDQPTSMQDLAFPRAGQGRGDTGAIPQAAGTVQFFVPGKPQGKGRPRAVARGKFVRMYTPEKTASYESTVALAASQAMAGRPPIEGPVVATLFIALPIPASWSKKKQAQAVADQLLPVTKPDADNTVKAVFDAINGVVWADDTQVVDLLVRKRYRARPGVSVTISPAAVQEVC